MRVVSLLPGATDTIAALGAGNALVAVSHECDWPPPLVATLPRVTSSPVGGATPAEVDGAVRKAVQGGESIFALDARRIVELRPDVIVTQALCAVCAVSESDVRAIARGIRPEPEVVTLGATTLDGVMAEILNVARVLGCEAAGATLVESLRGRMRHVHDTLAAARAPRPRVAVIEWTDPIYAAGHWVPDMLHRAGGADVLARAGEHSSVRTAAAIESAAPDVLVVAPCGSTLDAAAHEADMLMRRPEWRWAVTREVWAIDASALTSRPGPRLVEGVETLAAILHPALFHPPHSAHARHMSRPA